MTLSHSHTCLRADAYAFKRAAPFSYTDQTGWCYLLQNAGACKLEDFGVELYTRYHMLSNPSHSVYRLSTNRAVPSKTGDFASASNGSNIRMGL